VTRVRGQDHLHKCMNAVMAETIHFNGGALGPTCLTLPLHVSVCVCLFCSVPL